MPRRAARSLNLFYVFIRIRHEFKWKPSTEKRKTTFIKKKLERRVVRRNLCNAFYSNKTKSTEKNLSRCPFGPKFYIKNLNNPYSLLQGMASYPTILGSYRKSGVDTDVFAKLFDKFKKGDLGYAERCIVVGPGPGVNEFNFLGKLTPRLRHLICIERDNNCAALFEENADKLLSKATTVELHKIPVQGWTGPSEAVDVVLMFHCLYYLSDAERLKVLENCFNSWLKPGGQLIAMMIKDWNEDERHLMNEVYREQGGELLKEAYHVKKDILSLGYKIDQEHVYVNSKNLDQIDDDFLGFIKFHSKPVLKEDAIKDILTKLHENGNNGHCSGSLFSVIKTI